MKKKRLIGLAAGVFASSLMMGVGYADSGIKFVIDGQGMVPQVSQVVDGHTMVSVRFISDALGAKVSWDDASQTVSIDSQGKASLEREVDLFVRGLAPQSAEQAVNQYVNGIQHRNGALQCLYVKRLTMDEEKAKEVRGGSFGRIN